MITITREHVIYAHSSADQPAAKVCPGEQVRFETYDCYQGALIPEHTTFADINRAHDNPATGPLFVEGAEPGDTLCIKIDKIELGKVGILDKGATSGTLAPHFPETIIKRVHVENNTVYYDDVALPAKPMIGVIGVASQGEPVSTVTPMDHGGNMDCTQITEGSTLYLPVFTKGALLAMGDLHAMMGDGETGNCGIEIEGAVELTVDVIKQTGILYPMVENSDKWITIAYGKTLDETAQKAITQMFAFLCDKMGLSKQDAGMLLDMAGDLIVCQIVNPYKTMRMEIPKDILVRFVQKQA